MRKLLAVGFSLTLLTGMLGAVFVRPARAASFIVNNTTDADDVAPGDGVCETATGNGICTLRAAIREANALAGDDTITLPAGAFILSIAGSGEDAAATGDLDLNSNITLNGASATTTTISGAGDRVFHVLGGSVVISNVTVSGGNPGVSANGGGLMVTGGAVTLSNSLVSTNQAESGGGVAISAGSLAVNFSTLAGNTATLGSGGGLHVGSGTVVTINNSTISGNTASNATSGSGGGIFVNSGATGTLNNSTVSGNTASGVDVTAGGGGIMASGILNLNSATIAANTSVGAGGGVLQLGGTVNTRNTIIADNAGPAASPDCSGTLVSLGFNLLEDNDGCNGIINSVNGDIVVASITPATTFALDPLANYGGVTDTHRLIVPGNSALAVDTGNPAGCGDGASTFTTDQRGPGFSRAQNLRCDIGAFEHVPGVQTLTLTPTFTFTPSVTPTFTQSLTPSATNSPAPTNTITPSPIATTTRTATPAPKIPLFTPPPALPTPDVGQTQTEAAIQLQAAVAATLNAVASPTPDAAQTQTSAAATNIALSASPTITATPTAFPAFDFPPETAVLAISQAVGRAGGRFVCGLWIVEAGQDAIPEGSSFHCNTVSGDDPALPSLPSQLRAFWQAVEIHVASSNGQSIVAFTQPMRVCAYYKDDYLKSAGDKAENFTIYTASEGEEWESLPTAPDSALNRVCTAVDHLSYFRLAVDSSALGGPNLVGYAAIACGLLLLIVVIVVVFAIVRSRKPKAAKG